MKITEQNKQEAEKVIEMYWNNLPVNLEFYFSINCAIQDRQSVLEAMQHIYRFTLANDPQFPIVSEQIENLTEQIEYLQSKL